MNRLYQVTGFQLIALARNLIDRGYTLELREYTVNDAFVITSTAPEALVYDLLHDTGGSL